MIPRNFSSVNSVDAGAGPAPCLHPSLYRDPPRSDADFWANHTRHRGRRLIYVGHRRAGWWFGQDGLAQIQHSRLPRYDDTIIALPSELFVTPIHQSQSRPTCQHDHLLRPAQEILSNPVDELRSGGLFVFAVGEGCADDDGNVKRGISAQTFNFYLQAVKQFCRWLVKDRRASDNPLSHLTSLNVKTDRRHDRRALSVDEMRRLLHAVRNGPDRTGRSWRMTGPERAILYQLAMETGFRSSELRSLVRASFDLDGAPPPWRWKPGTASEDGVMFYPFCNRRPNCSGPFWLI